MYTADEARKYYTNGYAESLDKKIKEAVESAGLGNSAYMRVYIDDPWCSNIESELTNRGFKNIQVPSIILKGDVYFEW